MNLIYLGLILAALGIITYLFKRYSKKSKKSTETVKENPNFTVMDDHISHYNDVTVNGQFRKFTRHVHRKKSRGNYRFYDEYDLDITDYVLGGLIAYHILFDEDRGVLEYNEDFENTLDSPAYDGWDEKFSEVENHFQSVIERTPPPVPEVPELISEGISLPDVPNDDLMYLDDGDVIDSYDLDDFSDDGVTDPSFEAPSFMSSDDGLDDFSSNEFGLDDYGSSDSIEPFKDNENW